PHAKTPRALFIRALLAYLSGRNAPLDALTWSSMVLTVFTCPCYANFEPTTANGGKGVPHCLRERRAFPSDSARSSPRCVVSRLQPGLDAGTGNPYQTKPQQSPLHRAACETRDGLPREPYPNRCDGTCQPRYRVAPHL